jgi:periplasmic protein TonB
MSRARASRQPLTAPAVVSALLHGSLLLALIVARPEKPPSLPPLYKVDLVAAPPGERAIGVTSPKAPTPTTPKVDEPSPMSPVKSNEMPNPTRTRAPQRDAGTPVPDASKTKHADVQKAGGGETGGTGTDVVTVQTPGIEFPFPGYLNNIVRQIALNFKPRNANAALRAEVSFLIHRDGSVTNFRFMKQSGNYAFDLDAQGAIEAASTEFGKLPAGYNDDVLPIIFIFEPRLLR